MLSRATTLIRTLRTFREGLRFGYALPAPRESVPAAPAGPSSRLEDYFDALEEGPGMLKWRHYFSIYDRHLAKFVGRDVHVLEIGVYSGGSLAMWRDYFGDGCQVYGVDIAPECRAHERDGVRVFIGDQADPVFWRSVLEEVPRVDVVIDDGGHEAGQQIASLRCLLPHMAAGGVYICEDIEGAEQQFHSFTDGLCRTISDVKAGSSRTVHQHVASVHRYPLLTVFEKPDRPVAAFESVRRGSVWEPTIRL